MFFDLSLIRTVFDSHCHSYLFKKNMKEKEAGKEGSSCRKYNFKHINFKKKVCLLPEDFGFSTFVLLNGCFGAVFFGANFCGWVLVGGLLVVEEVLGGAKVFGFIFALLLKFFDNLSISLSSIDFSSPYIFFLNFVVKEKGLFFYFNFFYFIILLHIFFFVVV